MSIFIAKSADVYGDVRLGENVNIWFNVSIRGDINYITIGSDSNVQDNSVVHVSSDYPTNIGNKVTIGHGCIIHGCTINDNTLVGMGATILDGAVIGANSIIGANSLVTQHKVFPPNVMIMGSPAKVVRNLTEAEIKGITKNSENYVKNAIKYQNNEFKRLTSE